MVGTDKLEYLMWRDCEKYKLQLDETQNLSDEEIERRVDEIEEAIEESDPLFFVGKEMMADETEVDYDLGFRATISGDYVVTKEEFNLWKKDETEDPKLFCGNVGKLLCKGKRWKERFLILDKLGKFDIIPLANYSEIIKLFRESDLFDNNNIDFTDLDSVKSLFNKYQIYTYQEFFHQNRFRFKEKRFFLSDEREVYYFGYDKDEDSYYDIDGSHYFLWALDLNDE